MIEQSRQFLKGRGALLSPSKKASLDTKMSSLESKWNRLQAELDNRYMRLVTIHEKLTKFEELLHPYLVCLVELYFPVISFHNTHELPRLTKMKGIVEGGNLLRITAKIDVMI